MRKVALALMDGNFKRCFITWEACSRPGGRGACRSLQWLVHKRDPVAFTGGRLFVSTELAFGEPLR
jgi:hypothetical protein